MIALILLMLNLIVWKNLFKKTLKPHPKIEPARNLVWLKWWKRRFLVWSYCWFWGWYWATGY